MSSCISKCPPEPKTRKDKPGDHQIAVAPKNDSADLEILDIVVKMTVGQKQCHEQRCCDSCGLPIPQKDLANQQDDDGQQSAQEHGSINVAQGNLTNIAGPQLERSVE